MCDFACCLLLVLQKIGLFREQQKKLSALEVELAAAKQEGFVSKQSLENNGVSGKRPLIVIGVLTKFGRKIKRDAIRKAWMANGRLLLFLFLKQSASSTILTINC